jgi:hypothetical protein
MTKQEHELMLMMFVRMNESIGIIIEALKSRDILTGDDAKAFSHAIHSDDKKILFYATQTRADYLRCAALSGLTGLDV